MGAPPGAPGGRAGNPAEDPTGDGSQIPAKELASLADAVLRVAFRPAVEQLLRAAWDLRPDPGANGTVVVYRGPLVPRGFAVRYRALAAIAAGPAHG